MDYKEVLNFWFSEENSKKHWIKDANFDLEIRSRFLETYEKASKGELNNWEDNAESALALILVLDQFPRNMFRNTPEAFSTDRQALRIAKKSINKAFDKKFQSNQQSFFYLPYMHSENIDDQETCVKLFLNKPELENSYNYAIAHLDVIKEYGRFPHRNKILGRTNTPDEEIYLQDPNAGF